MHELLLFQDERFINITPLVSKLSWTSNVDSLGDKLSFDIMTSDAKYIPKNPVEVGSIIVLGKNTKTEEEIKKEKDTNKVANDKIKEEEENKKQDDELFRGIVITEKRSGRDSVSYDAFDYAFFLNKSKDIYQFNDMLAHDAIKKILLDYNVPCGHIATIPLTINKLFSNKTLSDIIKEILQLVEEQLGEKYRMEMHKGKLDIYKEKDTLIKATFKMANNLGDQDITRFIENPSRSRSIENMKNSIKFICDDNEISHDKDEELINKYGLLQEVRTINKDEKHKVKSMAKNLLKKLGRISEDNSLSLPGNDNVRAGRIIEIKEDITGMEGKYLIKNCTHTVDNGIHWMNLGLEVQKDG